MGTSWWYGVLWRSIRRDVRMRVGPTELGYFYASESAGSSDSSSETLLADWYSAMIFLASSAWDSRTKVSTLGGPWGCSGIGKGAVETEPGDWMPLLSSRPRITRASVAFSAT